MPRKPSNPEVRPTRLTLSLPANVYSRFMQYAAQKINKGEHTDLNQLLQVIIEKEMANNVE